MPAVRCIFLDLGRTLIDLNFGALGVRMKQLAGVQPEQLQKAVLDDGLAARFETGAIAEDEFRVQVCKRLGTRIPAEDFFAAWNSIFVPEPILPDDLIARLAKKAPLWALSNTNSAHYRFLVKRYSFFRFFSGAILSFEVGLQKPDEAIFCCALDKARVSAAESIFVDDHMPNIETACKLGIDAFQFVSREQFISEMHTRHMLCDEV